MDNSPIEQLFPLINEASKEWLAKNNYEKIKQDVHTKLDKSSEEIVLKLLGFDTASFHKGYELDHCNGRAGNSTAGDYLAKVQAEAIKEWLSTIKMPKLSNTLRKDIEADMQSYFDREIKHCVSKAVQIVLQEQIKELTNSISTTNIVEKYQETIKLIQGN